MDGTGVLTYGGLGRYGRLGNQLFQIAATIGVADAHGFEVRLGAWERRDEFRLPTEFFDPVPDGARDVREFAPQLPGVHIDYLQEFELFAESLDRVRRWLMPAPSIMDDARTKLGSLLDLPGLTAVHVRRTDYVSSADRHPPQPPIYYEEAMARLPRGGMAVVFTDDPVWCARELAHLRPAAIIEPGPDVLDLACMALCERHVIANSSYSYWGALLAGNDAAVYPSPWFGPDFADAHEISRVPPGWVAVDPEADRSLRGLSWRQRRWRRHARERILARLRSGIH